MTWLRNDCGCWICQACGEWQREHAEHEAGSHTCEHDDARCAAKVADWEANWAIVEAEEWKLKEPELRMLRKAATLAETDEERRAVKRLIRRTEEYAYLLRLREDYEDEPREPRADTGGVNA
jgi:hypothetical protein